MGEKTYERETWKSFLDGDLKAPPQISDSESDYESKSSKAGTPEETVEEQLLYNRRALSKNDDTYKLETFENHYMMVFNHIELDGYSEPRYGTDKDVESLKRAFSPVGFQIKVFDDRTKDEIMDELKVLKEKDFSDYGCIAVVVLTHGTHEGLIRAKDMKYSETEIIKHFKTLRNPSLITKPKILIIQACRGVNPIRGAYVKQMMTVHKDMVEQDESYTLPLEADILVFHSSYPGNPSHRVREHGSWLIKELCDEIVKNSSVEDLERIITEVKRKVAINRSHETFNRRTGEIDINKQMPVVMSTLIRKLYLRKFENFTCVDNDISKTEVKEPMTPLLVRFGPCSCFLDHFAYLKQCLRNIVNDHPEDGAARTLLDVCDTFEDSPQFNSSKEKMAKLISEHFTNTAHNFQFYKYMFMYKSQ